MSDQNKPVYEIKVSKTNNKVPVLDGVHLHSIYNPVKEAESYARNYSSQIMENNNILILGLAFGYHVNEIEMLARKFHGGNYRILVIEPYKQVADDCIDLNLVSTDSRVRIVSGTDVESLYRDKTLINFLLARPLVIAHTASFNYHKKYFENFLTFKSTTRIGSWIGENIENDISDFFKSLAPEASLDDYIQGYQDLPKCNRYSHLVQTLSEFSKLTKEETYETNSDF